MKKYLSIALLVVTLFMLCACNIVRTSSIDCTGDTTTKEYTNTNITEINVEDIYIKHDGIEKKVIFNTYASTENKIVIQASQTVIDDLSVKENKGEITIKGSRNKYYDTESIKIEVFGYKLDSIDLENAEGEIVGETLAVEFELDIRSCSNITLNNKNGGELEANVSGASKLTLNNLNCEVDIDASGASEITGTNLVASELSLSFSGASKGTLYVSGTETDVELSGGSSLTLIGTTVEFDAEESGGSSIEASEYNTETCEIELSGGSKLKVSVSRSIEYQLSGGSDLVYYGSISIIAGTASGNSTVKNELSK